MEGRPFFRMIESLSYYDVSGEYGEESRYVERMKAIDSIENTYFLATLIVDQLRDAKPNEEKKILDYWVDGLRERQTRP